MNIFAIGDLHLSGEPPKKPMHIFGDHWLNHKEKVFANWKEMIKEEDLVIICGDTSWAMKLKDALEDLNAIAELPGKKIILKGNHDYWWASNKKMQTATENKFFFLHNDSYIVESCKSEDESIKSSTKNIKEIGESSSTGNIKNEDESSLTESIKTENIEKEDDMKDNKNLPRKIGICGSRGWMLPGYENFKPEVDNNILRHEIIRLRASLDKAVAEGCTELILMLHYPPFYREDEPSPFRDLIEEYGVTKCYFGHLHGPEAAQSVFEGQSGNCYYKLVSCDTQNFKPILVDKI